MIEEHFNKLRRNLVLMSVLVLFVNVTGAKLNKVNLLGNEITLPNPDSLPLYMAIVLLYFLVRYVQYMHDIEDKQFRTRFFKRVEKNLEPYILNREHRNEKTGLKMHYPDINSLEYYGSLTMFNEAMPKNTAAASFCGKEGGAVIDLNEIHISNYELIRPFILSALYIIFRTRLVTDYVFLIAICLLAYSSYMEFIKRWLQV